MAKVLKSQQHNLHQKKTYSLKPNSALPPHAIAAMRPLPPAASQISSLLQYGEPVVLSKQSDTAKHLPFNAAGTATATAAKLSAKHSAQPLLTNPPGNKQATQLLPSDLIDILLPPRQWTTADGLTWTQPVSRDQTTPKDVLALNEMLDIELENHSARETGIDETRRKLYAQCLDECIRQITLELAERGVLLWRIKKEFEKNVAAFAALLESSQAFGIRKTVLSKQGQPELALRLQDLQNSSQLLRNELNHWKQQFEAIDKRNIEQRSQAEKLHQDEVSMFKRVNQQLKNQIEGLAKPKDTAGQDKSG